MPVTDDDVLLIGARVDLAQFDVGMNQMATAVAAKSKQMSFDFEMTTVAAKQLDATMGKLGGGGTTEQIAALEAQLAAMEATIAQLNVQVISLEEQLAKAPVKGTHQMTEARHALHGLGEEMGFHVPRFIQSFIASMDGVGTVLAKAFTVVAIVGILQLLPEVGKAIEDIAAKTAGWDDNAKKAYEHLIEANQKLYLESLKVKEENRAASEIGLTGMAKRAAHTKVLQENSRELGDEITKLSRALQQSETDFEATHHGIAALVRPSSESKEMLDEHTKSMERQRGVIDTLVEKLRGYHNELAVKDPAEAAAEANDERLARLKAMAEAQKTVSESSISFEIQSAKELYSIGSITQDQLTERLREAENQRYEIEKANIAKRRALSLDEQKTTGKDAGPELTALEAQREKLEVDHQAKLSAIKTEGDAKMLADSNAVNTALIKAEQIRVNAQVALDDAAAKQRLAIHQISISQETAVLLDGEQKKFNAEKKVKEQELLVLRQNEEKNKAAIITAQASLEAFEKEHQARMDSLRADGANKGIEENRRLLQETVKNAEDSANKELQLTHETDNGRLQSHSIGLSQWAANEKAAIDKWYTDQKAVLLQQLAFAEHTFGRESVEYKKMLDKMHQLDLQKAIETQKVENKIDQNLHQSLSRMTQSFNGAFTQWAMGHESFGKAFMQMEDQMASNFIQNSLKMLEQMLVGVLMHKAVLKSGIMADAKSAAAHTYTSIAAIPIVGPFLAPPAAAAAFAAVMAFGSFNRGGVVPEDMMGQVHKNEMVLDPSLSTGLQNLIRSGSPGGTAQTINMGGVAIHNHGGSPQQTEEELAKMFRRAARKGMLAYE